MPVRQFSLVSPADQLLTQANFLDRGTLPWLLRGYPGLLFPRWLFRGWKGEARGGRCAWPAPTLMALLLLRFSEPGMTRKGATRRARFDAEWRAALRLPWEVEPPDEKTLREFEAFLKTPVVPLGIPRIALLFEHWLRLCLEEGVVGAEPTWVIDSTPFWCYGAVLDTFNLLGEGLRALGRRWARARGVDLAVIAAEWQAPVLLAKSAKGSFEGVDWGDSAAQSRVLTELVELAARAVDQVTSALSTVRENKREPLLRRCRNLQRVVQEDLETAEDGSLRIAQRVTSQRLISLTDPEAQHFRKSHSQVCAGFKLHVLGDAISGLILALSVTPGGHHDGSQAHPLLVQAKKRYAALREVLGDAAYGAMSTRIQAREELGITVLAPPAPERTREGQLGKADVAIDFEAMSATCPGGVLTSTWKPTKVNGTEVPTFCWPVGSEEECRCREKCPVHRPHTTKAGRKCAPRRRLPLHPQEQELRRLRQEWKDPQTRRRYRKRSQGERLMEALTRRGARRAGAWGLAFAELQAHCTAGVQNLSLLARKLAEDEMAQRRAA